MEQWIEKLKGALPQLAHALLTVEEVVFLAGAFAGILASLLLVWIICALAANVNIFRKAGESGWKGIVPIYCSYINYRICWRPLWFWISALLLASSAALKLAAHSTVTDALAIGVCAAAALLRAARLYRLSKVFGHGLPFTLGLVFLHPVFILILGLGSSQYQGNRFVGAYPAERL